MTYVHNPDEAWRVLFDGGDVGVGGKTEGNTFVRCVRGGNLNAAWVDNHDGTVSDSLRGFMWQQGDNQNDQGSRNWEQALGYCKGLDLAGKGDWRLPNYRELASLVDYSRYNPSISPFFSCRSDHYWSNSTWLYYPDKAWTVDFDGGHVAVRPTLITSAVCAADHLGPLAL
jgi:hypothetical protein